MTQFQDSVYRVVAAIPAGSVMTYKEVAVAAGRPRAYRAVGNILNTHEVEKLPCHRVVRSDGALGGYRDGARKKITLLRREGIQIVGQ